MLVSIMVSSSWSFDNICLRHIFRIPYTDHAPNATVRLRASSPPQSATLVSTHPGQAASLLRALWQEWIPRLTSPEHSMSIRGLPRDWRRPPRRPRRTWLRTLEADLQPHNLGLNSTWRLAQDRGRWQHLVETAMLQLGARS